jgi:glucan 1,3-beta-glucosidase
VLRVAMPFLCVTRCAALLALLALPSSAQPCDFWYESITHGSSFRNAQAFGAKGDGVSDDTAAIQAAFDFQQGGGDGSNLTTTQAVVYLPPGTYLISDTLVIWFWGHLVGNAICPPTLLLAANAPGFSGVAGLKPVVTSNLGFNISVAHHAWWVQGKAVGGHANDLFYVHIRNVNLRVLAGNDGAVGILWPVAQQTSLRRISIDMTASGAIGIDFQGGADYNVTYPYNSSIGGGGTVEDIIVLGASTGLRLAASQWTYRNITVVGASSACISATSTCWALTIISANLSRCPTALVARISGQGSVLLLDSTLGPGLDVSAVAVNGTQGGVYLQAVTVVGAPAFAVEGILPTPVGGTVASWGLGSAFLSGAPLLPSPFGHGHLPLPRAAAAVAAGVPFACASDSGALLCGGSAEDPSSGLAAARGRPDFAELPFVSASHYGAVGDGVADDTAALQRGLASGAPLFLPSGVYRVSDTLTLPCNFTLVGEGLAAIALSAAAPGFNDADALKAVVATAPSTPSAPCFAHVADVTLTTLGAGNEGALLLNHTGSSESGFWDVSMRLYGFPVALKAQLGPAVPQDPRFSHDSGGGVLSNAWWWVADHNISDMKEMSNSTPGCTDHCNAGQELGVQISTQGPLLLIGTNFEHAGALEYNLTGASNVVGSVIQTEGETISALLVRTGATGPLVLFGTVFGSSTGHGDNKTLLAGSGRGACVDSVDQDGVEGRLDLSYRLLGSAQRLQVLLAVDEGPSLPYDIKGNLTGSMWDCVAVYRGCV